MKRLINYNNPDTAVLIFFLAVFITSCEYEPKDKYKVDLTKPTEPPPIEVDLNFMTDTIYFYWDTPVNLNINSGNLKVLYVKFSLDGDEVYGEQSGTNYSTVLYFTQAGVHKFKITIVTHSGSNSLADILGAEGFKYESREWTLIARELTNNNGMSYKIIDNKLVFSWKEYDGINFKGYRLKERSTGNVFNVQTNSFINTAYAGEMSYYDLYVVDNANEEYGWGNCFVNKSLPVLKLANINNRIALTWNIPSFKDNIAELQVFQTDLSYNWTKIGTLTTSDTSIFINTPENVFCQWSNFYLYCVPKQYTRIEYTSYFSSFLEHVNAALPGPVFIDDFGITCSGFYFRKFSSALGRDITYKYSIPGDKVIPLRDYSYYSDISPNAKYLLNPGDSILDLYDLNTNSVVKSINIKRVAAGFDPSVYPKISDNGICTFISHNVFYVYDIINDHLISAETLYASCLKISPNGKYISAGLDDSLKIYQINESSVTYLSGMKKPGGFFASADYNFFPDQDDKLYMYESPVMHIRSSRDFSTLRSMDIGSWFFNIDFCSNKIFTPKNASSWNIYDLNTGNLLQTIKSDIGSGGSNYTLLTNNTIYYTGYKYYLAN